MLVMLQLYAHKNGKYTVITAFSVSPVNKCFANKNYSRFINYLNEEGYNVQDCIYNITCTHLYLVRIW